MRYAVIVVAVLAIIGIVMFLRNRKFNGSGTKKAGQIADDVKDISDNPITKLELALNIEQLPIEMIPEESKLIEIKDKNTLARIDSLVPGLAQAGVSVANAVEATGETFYRVVIPNGAKLADSKAMEGAVRGIFHGEKGIKGQANWFAIDRTGAAAANTAAAAMGVASMVVGQYYMTQINAELNQISNELDKISNFQDNEYRSKVFALFTQVQKISGFQKEILENDTLRKNELNHLNSLEDQCIKLLGQANLTVAGFAKKEDLDYEAYEVEIKEAQSWYLYQQTLLEVMNKISDLKYALNFGEVSREQCTALLPTYIKQTKDSQAILSDWHKKNIERLAIDTSESKRKRQGFDGVIHWIPGKFDDAHNYAELGENISDMIEFQCAKTDYASRISTSERYYEDVHLISKGGKIYYYPTSIRN